MCSSLPRMLDLKQIDAFFDSTEQEIANDKSLKRRTTISGIDDLITFSKKLEVMKSSIAIAWLSFADITTMLSISNIIT